jgi:hypothetical protein
MSTGLIGSSNDCKALCAGKIIIDPFTKTRCVSDSVAILNFVMDESAHAINIFAEIKEKSE